MPVDSQGVDYATPTPHRSSAPLLFIAWLIVGVPAAWGVTQTVKRSMDLFTAPNPCLLYTSPSPRDISGSRMPSSA